jgi:hypothetical protein
MCVSVPPAAKLSSAWSRTSCFISCFLCHTPPPPLSLKKPLQFKSFKLESVLCVLIRVWWHRQCARGPRPWIWGGECWFYGIRIDLRALKVHFSLFFLFVPQALFLICWFEILTANCLYGSGDGSVGIVTSLRLDHRGFVFRVAVYLSVGSKSSRPAGEPIQPPIKSRR